jgi:hypothetical protein
MSPEEREAKIAAIGRRVTERLRQEWPEGEAHLNDLEDAVTRVGRELMRELTQEWVNEQLQQRRRGGQQCRCGATAAYKGAYHLELVTLHGRFSVRRPYYYCGTCRQGSCPLDQEWQLGAAHSTPSVQALVALLSASGAYVGVPQLLRQLRLPISLCVRSLEQITQAVGERVREAAPAPAHGRAFHPLVAAVDEAMLPLCGGGHQAVRCGTVYEADWWAKRTPAGERALRKEYVATLGSQEALLKAVCERVEARRPHPEQAVVALGDGALWIWAGYATHLPNRVEILDFYHAAEHVGAVAEAWFGGPPLPKRRAAPAAGVAGAGDTGRAPRPPVPPARRSASEPPRWEQGGEARRQRREAAYTHAKAKDEWIQQRLHGLKTHGPKGLLRLLERWKPESAAAQEVRRRELGYFTHNRERMDYPRYQKRGFPIGSGAVEGACKHVVGDRMKRTGMHWKPNTAEPVLQLRAALLTQPDLDLRQYLGRPALA